MCQRGGQKVLNEKRILGAPFSDGETSGQVLAIRRDIAGSRNIANS
jgi:hypothetical protein